MSLHPHVTSSSGSQIFSTDPCTSKIMYLKSSNWLHPVNCYPKKRSQSDNKSATVTLVSDFGSIFGCLSLMPTDTMHWRTHTTAIPFSVGTALFLSPLSSGAEPGGSNSLFFHAGFMLLILLTAKATQFSILIQKRVFSICQTLNMLVTPPDS